MSDHVVLHVNHLMTTRPDGEADQTVVVVSHSAEAVGPCSSSSSSRSTEGEGKDGVSSGKEVEESDDEAAEPLIQVAECRICQEEDSVKNLESPCACRGSLKYAHRKCVQHWCNEKGDITCEICHQPYQPGYTAPPRPVHTEETAIHIGEGWSISGSPLDASNPHLLAIAEVEHFLETDHDDYAASSATGAAFCRSAALILMALLLLRHALDVTDADGNDDDDISTFFSLFLLRAASFLLPCYIMAWALSILQRRRQRQEAAALAARQVAFVLHSRQRRGVHYAITPAPAVAHETV